jgi:hypothetical protein
MKRYLLLAALVLLPLSACGEWIQDYLIDLEIQSDGYVSVSEEITVFFDVSRHGIYRMVPYSYRLPTGERYKLRITVEEVLANGAEVPVKVTREGEYLKLRIGDPDVLVKGAVTYTIRYRLARALRVYGDEVEFYWNAIGTEWPWQIEHARVTVRLPAEVPQDAVRIVGYQGYLGAREEFQLAWVGDVLVGETKDLVPGQGVTVAVRFPKGYVVLPGAWQELVWFLQDNLYAGIPLLVLLGMTVLWWHKGRDPKKGTIAPAFTPPKGIGPAEAGVLVDDRFDPRDLSAAIVGLAVKGHLRLREVWEDERGKEPDDFELIREEGKEPLTDFEEALLEALFAGEERKRLSELRYKLYEKVPGLAARLYMGLTEQGYYAGNPDRVRNLYRGIGLGVIVLGFALGVYFASLYLGAAVGVSGLIIWAFARIMPRKTRKGMKVLREILGLEEYIRRAEVERIEFAAAEKHFEELLPYAMALGLTEVWAHKFEGLLQRPPDWYDGRFPTFAPYLLGYRLAAFHYAARSAATSVPRSAAKGGWSGGSGFGGGGFSGGGMGGGGGGSW